MHWAKGRKAKERGFREDATIVESWGTRREIAERGGVGERAWRKEKERESTRAKEKGEGSKARATTAGSLDTRPESVGKEKEESGEERVECRAWTGGVRRSKR